ncbi:asparaginase [Paenibacillus silviterrae]|uniref:asparaginase n=1 Tax=Paenibacillus silviterrae TaxID=3242194 RepID=UPI0025432D7E|nr:asparaginase [Paenibacillus chinjuensis]
MQELQSDIVVTVTRGPLTESMHRGHIAVVDIHGELQAFTGNPDYYGFIRSTAKPLQAIPLAESNAWHRLGLSAEQTALLCASHNGEDEHTAAALSILQQLSLDVSALQCGIHEPFYKPAADALKRQGSEPTPLHNNCSGKHAGMLALSTAIGASIQQYTSLDHPVQQKMLQTVSEMSGMAVQDIRIGTDGCGVPVFAMPLSALAYAYARLGDPRHLSPERAGACRTLLTAMQKVPFYVAGSERYDTLLAKATHGRIIGKMGAEAVYAATVPERGLGIAVKIEDGHPRALYPAITEALAQLGLLTGEELSELAEFHRPAVRNHRGEEVGRIEPVFRLHTPKE